LGLRITVPGPLRFRRLAVPQTSWNLFHYDPDVRFRQRFSHRNGAYSSSFICFVSNQLQHRGGVHPVDNTRVAENVLLQFEDHAVIRSQPQILLVGAGQNRPPGDRPVIHRHLGPGTHVAALENFDIPGYDAAT
jgi:hypothetical protein